jgi:hypothetical protein
VVSQSIYNPSARERVKTKQGEEIGLFDISTVAILKDFQA